MKRRVISPPGQLEPEMAAAIDGCISIGPGEVHNVSVNGVLLKEEVKWEHFCILDPAYGGLTCDGVSIVEFHQEDTWYVESMSTQGETFNRVDAERYKRYKAQTATATTEVVTAAAAATEAE